MPRYDAKRIEPRWQKYWEENKIFAAPEMPTGKKLYVLDMFPYPSGSGLHVGHPEGYTATDIVCRYSRMKGKSVLHPMGWDAFGLPAEQHAIKTGTHPRITTYQNIDTFRRQLKMLGFSYDWDREFSTTDEDYFRWTQWIFLELFDTWYDPEHLWTGPDGVERMGKGRPIAELPIPDDVANDGEEAVRRYQDRHRLAYQHEAPVNWCPALGTVLANEEVTAEGLSERGAHPVERIPLRQWMLRITAYAERLLDELEDVDWSESIKLLQRNWIGKSTGAEVDFFIGDKESDRTTDGFDVWKSSRRDSGLPSEPGEEVLRVYTTRPDTLFGATYMVLAPEHPYVERLTTAEQAEEVAKYQRQASLKSDLDRTDLAKEKTGVFTGSYAFNPVNGEQVPIWIADYVLISYGTGAIMAVPAHDERDFEFAKEFQLPIKTVVSANDQWLWENHQFAYEDDAVTSAKEFIDRPMGEISSDISNSPIEELANSIIDNDALALADLHATYPYLFFKSFAGQGTAINSGDYNGLSTADFKAKITSDLAENGLGKQAVNYKLRDWLFSRQHFWGEPFPIWHELDKNGNRTGLLRTDDVANLPVTLPEDFEFKGHGEGSKSGGSPEPPLAESPDEWLYRTAADGTKLLRETNTMPQWAGSCWYYIRFADPKNDSVFIDPEKERAWLPVDLYIGGAEHAVLHLLYSRFWHKVLFDRGHVTIAEPFQKLVNQGMILGEPTYYVNLRVDKNGNNTEVMVSADVVDDESNEGLIADEATGLTFKSGEFGQKEIPRDQVDLKKGVPYFSDEHGEYRLDAHTEKMSKSRGNVVNPDDVVNLYGADSLRMYEMFMGPLEQVKPWSMSGVDGVARFLGRVWRMFIDERANEIQLNVAVQDVKPNEDQLRTLHKTIKAVTEDIEKLSFNTAISRMMEFTNEFSQQEPRPKSALESFILLLSPFAPHIAEELWHICGHDDTLAYEPWPEFDESKIVESTVEIPVQVNGKLRSKVSVAADADQATIEAAARADGTVAKQLEGRNVVKVIVVPGRLVNFVVKG